MPRSGGRLGLTGALNRNMPSSVLNTMAAEPNSKQASVCQLERDMKTLKEENNRLRNHLEEARSALKELTSEASLEKFDERRVNLLKMQIIQLQRQVLLMSEALGSRSSVLMEVENALTWLSEKFRYYIGVEVRGAEVPVKRSDLITMVETSESARIKLFKNVENCSKENLSHPQMLMNSFLKPGKEQEFTTLDCCLGRLDCLNLKHVAQLESRLARLYRELIQVSEHLQARAESKGCVAERGCGEPHMGVAVREREGTVILRACALSRECAADLLSLSLLFPSAPWPPLKKPSMAEVTYEALAPSLPPLPRGKAGEVERCVRAALKACNHRCHMTSLEAGALREEVRFHQQVYSLQLDYVQQAFDALRQGYGEFEQSTNQLLIQPMKKLLEAYTMLKTNTSHEGLKEFLTILKQHEQQWVDIIQKLDTTDPQNQSGSAVLSAFGEEFMSSLDRLVRARQTQRDKATSNKEELRTTQQRLEAELRDMIRDREEQQKIAREMKSDKNMSNNLSVESETPSISHRSSSSGVAEPCEASEGIAGLRPWLDSPHGDSSSSGAPNGKRRKSTTERKPWQDLGELEQPEEGDRSSGVLCSGRSLNSSTVDYEAVTGLRPWLDEQNGVENPQKTRVSAKGRKSREVVTPGSKGSDQILESYMHPSSNDLNIGLHYDAGDDRPGSLPPLYPENLNQLHSESGNLPSKPTHSVSKPPMPTESSSKRPPPADKEKTKRPAKPRNYEPKLYVANRTLSLRRSGSLNKLSDPSLQDQMSKLTLTSRQARARNDSGSK